MGVQKTDESGGRFSGNAHTLTPSHPHNTLKGRTNKLVDGCYSFWQGGIFPLMYKTLLKESGWSKDHMTIM